MCQTVWEVLKNEKIDDAYNSNIVDFLLDLFGIINHPAWPGDDSFDTRL